MIFTIEFSNGWSFILTRCRVRVKRIGRRKSVCVYRVGSKLLFVDICVDKFIVGMVGIYILKP